ncbi:hypothetical protein GCM10022281_16910 [Sphingomonas rosea]|uniref:Cadherin domain-containing protein n=1 Tax=Sphingomonas rosea TaxID=335605 RepID=A0ABP7U6G6_9SPHN
MSDVYFKLSGGDFSQDWSDTAQISVNDDWSGVASIIGYRGDGLTSATGTNPQTITGTSTVVNVIANQSNPNTLTSGGVAEFQIANPVVALQGSGTAAAPYLAFYLDSTGRQNVSFSFTPRDIDGSGDNAVQQVAVQYRIGNTGPWINLPAGYIADASTGPSLTQQLPTVSVTLPADANNQPQLQIRVMTTNAVGNDEWIGIDDIKVTSSAITLAQPGILNVSDASLVEDNSGSHDMLFTVSRSGGSDGAVAVAWTVKLDGTANAADLGSLLSGTVSFADGQTSAAIRVPVLGDVTPEPGETFSVVLSAPTGGATIGDGLGIGTIVNDDLPPLANVFINEINYDPAGADTGEFIELAGVAGTDLTGWKVVLYNGNGGAAYNTVTLSGALADQANGFGFKSLTYLPDGIQNGAPDGIALVDPYGRVVQFLSYEGTMTATSGPAAGLTATDIGVFQAQAPLGTSLQLQGTGSSYGDFSWGFNIAGTSGGANVGQTFLSGTDQGQIRIADAATVEGTGGTSSLTFTVTRAGGFASEASATWSIAFDGGATADDLAAGAITSGTVTFAAGEYTKTITVPVATDSVGEDNEAFTVNLSGVTGNATIVDGAARGIILNDDPIPRTIMAIQGEGHVSSYVGQPVITTGIVTALDTSGGFWIQDATGDGNARTSDAIYVRGTAPVAVGDAVQVTGTVQEYKPSDTGLSVTQIAGSALTIQSSGNALPDAVKIGVGGLLPPTEHIDSDGLTVFNPNVDGIDFWESLEGMRVTIDSPIAVGNSNAFGETEIVASGGAGATGINERGGITISAGDYNPEKIQLDDKLSAQPFLTQGDVLGSVTGIINYSFDRYEVLATETATVTKDVTLGDNDTVLKGDANFVSVATYNLENMDPSDQKYDVLAHDIVYSLGAPDILAVQEVQDADGAGKGTDLSGASNAQGLIDAIFAATGIVYTYVEIAPTTANSTGGEPNGNIRNGYLYQADRVTLVDGSLGLIGDSAFSGSRQPLVATWSFNGQEFTTINVHLTSRGGSDPLWGDKQPPADAGDAARTAQAAAVGAYVFDILSQDSAKQFMILGDWNGFQFEKAQTQLTDTGVFTNLSTLLPSQERYSYVFDGNAQLIDNMLVTGGLFDGAKYDAVHINAEFGGERPTDHDPQVALLRVAITPHDVVLGGSGSVDENLPAGAIVGSLSATDTPGDVLTYSLVSGGDGKFAIDAKGVVTTTAPLDHEGQASYELLVKVTDSAGLTSQNKVTVLVGDVNEAPVAKADAIAVDEDATSGNLWSLLLGNDSDPDAGEMLSISAVGTAGTHGSLIFDAASQTLRYVADGDAFDALATGATAVDSFTYTVTDKGGLTSTATVNVTVTGIADGVTRSGGNGNDALAGTAGEDTLYGNNGNDSLDGGSGHDRLDGGNGNDLLTGGTGHDILLGGSGNDVLDGGAGNDFLSGGMGDDWLTGGAGKDVFEFSSKSGNDVIFDFDKANDRLLFEGGTGIRSVQTTDWDQDGVADLRIVLTGGGSVTLLGVSSLAGVAMDTSAGKLGLVDGGFAGHATLAADGWLVS